jgi:hypothetical protein
MIEVNNLSEKLDDINRKLDSIQELISRARLIPH